MLEKTMALLSGRSNEDDHNRGANVVKIVLFTITGAIVAFFGTIALIRGIQVYRHPERYMPQNTADQSMRNRAKGITHAILGTIPIIRFAEKTEVELDSVEQGNSNIDKKNQEDAAGRMTKRGGGDPSSAAVTEMDVAGALGGERHLKCSICTEDFSIGEQVRVLPCLHQYHPGCVDPWLLNLSSTCPLCRIDLGRKEQRQSDCQVRSEA
ncbi:Ring finger domain-containing protein [Cladophialophora immunda]|nr:Ring finger domain-containing protein [Cladophialophora immunda]